ncbi:MAG: DUF3871 family protein, partial [Cyanobacteria bacterium J06649_11]
MLLVWSHKVMYLSSLFCIEHYFWCTAKFITANSQSSSLQSIRNQHIIPVFVKDNQPTIS